MKGIRNIACDKWIRFCILLCSLCLLLVGCQQSETPEKENLCIGFLVSNPGNEFMLAMQDGFQNRAESLGLEVRRESSDTSEEQLAQGKTLLGLGVDALVIWPNNGNAIVSLVEEANAQKVPVFTFDTKARGGEIVSQISTDNILVGKMAAETMAEMIYERTGAYQGVVTVAGGYEALSSHCDRVDGFQQVMEEKYPEITVVVQQNLRESEKIVDIVSNWLGIYGEKLVGIYSVTDYLTLPIWNTIEQMKTIVEINDIVLLGTDAFPAVVEKVRSGDIDGVVAQNAIRIGEQTADTAYAYLVEGQEVDPEQYVPTMVFTPDNMESEEVKAFGIWSDIYGGQE